MRFSSFSPTSSNSWMITSTTIPCSSTLMKRWSSSYRHQWKRLLHQTLPAQSEWDTKIQHKSLLVCLSQLMEINWSLCFSFQPSKSFHSMLLAQWMNFNGQVCLLSNSWLNDELCNNVELMILSTQHKKLVGWPPKYSRVSSRNISFPLFKRGERRTTELC